MVTIDPLDYLRAAVRNSLDSGQEKDVRLWYY
jgi:hypothetical protein